MSDIEVSADEWHYYELRVDYDDNGALYGSIDGRARIFKRVIMQGMMVLLLVIFNYLKK